MRILLGIENLQATGGTELHCLKLATALQRRGHTVGILSMASGDGPMLEQYARVGIAVYRFPVRGFLRPSVLAQLWRARRFLRDWRPDVVHAQDAYSSFFWPVAGRMAGVHRIIASRRWWHVTAKQRLFTWVGYWLADLVVANAPLVARALQREYRLPPRRVTSIGNVLPSAAFDAPPAEAMHRWRPSGAEPTTVVVGMIAQLRAEKDHLTLLQALRHLTDRGSAVHALIIGGGESAPLRQAAQQLGIAAHVTFTGELPNAPNPAFLCDIVVLTSRHEGLPNCLVEAMAAGRPVVATAVGGIPDLVIHGETGWLVEPGDAVAVAEAIHALLPSTVRAAFGARAREAATRTMGEEVILNAFEVAYAG